MKINNLKYLEIVTLVLLIMLMVFSRSLTGLYLFGFRLGELIIGFGIFLSIFMVFNFFINKKNKHKLLNKYYLVLLMLFLLSLFVNRGDLNSLYSFKSSSYIWTVSFIFLGIYLSNVLQNKNLQYIIVSIPIVIYILGTIHYPIYLQNFFITNSDKFEFQKASDLLIAVLISLLVAKTTLLSKKNYIYYLCSLIGLFIPLFLFMSKGSLLAFIFYCMFEIVLNINFLKKNIKLVFFGLIISSMFFSFSTLNIWGDFSFSKPQNLFGLLDDSSELTISDKFADLYKTKALDFEHPDKLLYIVDGRIYSNDVTSNWRLQIWQDVIEDLIKKNKILFGYGYNEIIPAMDDVERRGTDGTNENVHNYFINILARGGLVQVLFFMFFYIKIINKYFSNQEKLYAIQFVISVLLVSFFDSSMESVRFPLIFYFFSGCFLHQNIKNRNTYNGL